MEKVNVDSASYDVWEGLVKQYGSREKALELLNRACHLMPIMQKTFNSADTKAAKEEAEARGESHTMLAFDFTPDQEEEFTQFISHYESESKGVDGLLRVYELAELILASHMLKLSWPKDEKEIELSLAELHGLMHARLGV